MVGCLQENQAVPKDQISAHEAAQNSVIWMLGSRSAWHRLLAFFTLQTLAVEGVSCEGTSPYLLMGPHAALCRLPGALGLNPCGWAVIQEGCL